MPRRALLLPTLGLCAAAVLACGGGNKIPKPWVKREGQKEVVGNPGDVDHSIKTGEDGEAEPDAGLRSPNTRVVNPDEGDNLPPVADSYEELQAAGRITTCPEGTQLVDDRKDNDAMYCVLPDGVRHGPYLSWHPGGPVKEVGPYVAGRREGTWVTWDVKGRKYSTYQWKDGSPASGEVYH